jgi:hypothetical protein
LAQSSLPGEFIAVAPNEFVVEVWNTEGVLRRLFAVNSSWMPKGRGGAPVSGAPPPPTITGVSLAADGLLWSSGYHVNEKWRLEPIAGARNLGPGRVIPISPNRAVPTDMYAGFTTVVDAIDFESGTVLASASYEGEVLALFGAGYAYSRHQDDSGVITVKIWRLEVRRPGS